MILAPLIGACESNSVDRIDITPVHVEESHELLEVRSLRASYDDTHTTVVTHPRRTGTRVTASFSHPRVVVSWVVTEDGSGYVPTALRAYGSDPLGTSHTMPTGRPVPHEGIGDWVDHLIGFTSLVQPYSTTDLTRTLEMLMDFGSNIDAELVYDYLGDGPFVTHRLIGPYRNTLEVPERHVPWMVALHFQLIAARPEQPPTANDKDNA